jgi:hypothetical protein
MYYSYPFNRHGTFYRTILYAVAIPFVCRCNTWHYTSIHNSIEKLVASNIMMIDFTIYRVSCDI